MRLTVLGSSASYAGSGQACAGYLVQGGGANVLLDCGNGVVANLSQVIDPLELDAIFITHEHPDHFLDLYAVQALLNYAPQGPAGPLDLHMPEGLFDRMGALLSERGRVDLRRSFNVAKLTEDEPIRVEGLVVTPRRVEHTEATCAMTVQDGSVSLCYTADTAFGPAVVDAAQGCDLLLSEATLPEKYRGAANHLTAREAGEIAMQSRAQRLVLTHVCSGPGLAVDRQIR